MVTCLGSCGKALARLSGSSTGTPAVSSGAVTMKMISSTSMTSTSGVTLISAMAPRLPRRPRRREPDDERFIATVRSSPLVGRGTAAGGGGGSPPRTAARSRCPPPSAAARLPPPHEWGGYPRLSSLSLQFAAQRRMEPVGETLEPRLEVVYRIGKPVVGNHRRDRREQADSRREQRLGDPGRHHRQRGILLL